MGHQKQEETLIDYKVPVLVDASFSIKDINSIPVGREKIEIVMV